MIIKSYKDVVPYRLQDEEAKGAYIRPLISEEDGVGDFHLELLRLEPGGQTATSQFSHPQQMFVRKGDGEVMYSSNVREVKEGDVLLIREEEEFQLRNPTEVDFEVLIATPANFDLDREPSEEEEVEEEEEEEE